MVYLDFRKHTNKVTMNTAKIGAQTATITVVLSDERKKYQR